MVYIGIALVFALTLGLYFIYQIREVVLVFLLALLFTVIVSGPVNYLERHGLGRGWGLLLVISTIAFALWLAGASIAPVVHGQARQLVKDFPALLSEVEGLIVSLQSAIGIQPGVALNLGNLLSIAGGFFSGNTVSAAAGFGKSVANTLSLGLVVFIATIYSVIQPAPLVNGFVAFFPAGWRQRTREILGEMYISIQKWFIGQLISMVSIGLLSFIALAIIGIPFSALLGIFSGLISFVPLVGPVISVIPPVLLALASHPIQALWVVLAYIIIQQIESHLIQPVVMSWSVHLHPAVVIFALLIMGTLFGLIGLLLAVPLVAALQVLVIELWTKRMDKLGKDSHPPVQVPVSKKPGLLERVLSGLRRS